MTFLPHMEEVCSKLNVKIVYLWQSLEDEGTILDVFVQRRRITKGQLNL